LTTIPTTPFELKDPTAAPAYGDGPLSRWCKVALYEPRDEVFIRLTLKVSVVMLLAMAGLFAFFHWSLVPVYLAVWGWYAPPVILMLHCTMHRPFVRHPKWLGRAHPYVMSFLFGIPTGYAEHHMGMHHIEDNMPEDLSSTIRYRRDSFLHFLVYWGRLFIFGVIELPLYLTRKRRRAMVKRVIAGELAHQALIVVALLIDWRFGLVAFAFPYFTVRFMMMAGNWGQHAFINTGRKNDGISNAITCINCSYNRRAFNDGYHIGHHLKANRHWTELPQDFFDNWETYARSEAIVFEGLDFFLVSLLLWTGQWRVLARRFVRLNEGGQSDEDVIVMLKSRVQPVHVEDWAAMQPRSS
jgi:fatty acid desaturase